MRTESVSKIGRRCFYSLDDCAFDRLDFTTGSFEAAGVVVAVSVLPCGVPVADERVFVLLFLWPGGNDALRIALTSGACEVHC